MARRTAIVTGASRGIGRGIAESLAGRGYRIAINYNRNAEAAEQAKQAVEAAGGEALIVQADVAEADDRRRLVEQTVDAFGPIDVLVNNAGVAPSERADLLDASEQSFDRLVRINLKGPYFLTQLVARHMLDADGPPADAPGRVIVNVSSISAYTASVNRGDYCITKAGISMSTKLWATRLAEHGINVYEVQPGIIATDMTSGVKEKYDHLIGEQGITPIRRWGTPEDVGRAVLAAAEGYLPFSTGEVINVDGGFHLHRL
jgi:NAD(P)-dependent dehydrogenase (short-subunit alcohol dehydrogenase family)